MESSEAQNDPRPARALCAHTQGLRFTGTEAGGAAECTGWLGEAGCGSTTFSALGSVLLMAYILAPRLTKHRMQSADDPSMEIDS